jgi:hypothetical protein
MGPGTTNATMIGVVLGAGSWTPSIWSVNLTHDTFSNSEASAEGSEFRTPDRPAFSARRPGLSQQGYWKSNPAGTVTTNREFTNAPLVVRSLDDAIPAAIDLHDLPAPDDERTPKTDLVR